MTAGGDGSGVGWTAAKVAGGSGPCAPAGGLSGFRAAINPISSAVPATACVHEAGLPSAWALWRATKLWRISAPDSIRRTSTSQLCSPCTSQP